MDCYCDVFVDLDLELKVGATDNLILVERYSLELDFLDMGHGCDFRTDLACSPRVRLDTSVFNSLIYEGAAPVLWSTGR